MKNWVLFGGDLVYVLPEDGTGVLKHGRVKLSQLRGYGGK